MASEIEKFIDKRRQLRKKYFETDGYYKWSDMIDETNYQLRSESCFIRSIIAGEHKNWNSDLTKIIKNHINDPKVNWNAIFNYLDDVLASLPKDEFIIREEIVYIMSYLDEHKEKALPVYTGF